MCLGISLEGENVVAHVNKDSWFKSNIPNKNGQVVELVDTMW